jgi:hypothetical protein
LNVDSTSAKFRGIFSYLNRPCSSSQRPSGEISHTELEKGGDNCLAATKGIPFAKESFIDELLYLATANTSSSKMWNYLINSSFTSEQITADV